MDLDDDIIFSEDDCKKLRDAKTIRTYAVYDKARALLDPLGELKDLNKDGKYRKKDLQKRRETIGGNVDRKDRFHDMVANFVKSIEDRERILQEKVQRFF